MVMSGTVLLLAIFAVAILTKVLPAMEKRFSKTVVVLGSLMVQMCIRDRHTAMLLGAAKLLKQNQDQIEGTVKVVFQPDEEGFTGAKKMIEAGVPENPKVDAAMAMHVNSGTPSNLVVCGLGTSIGLSLIHIS